MMNQGMGLTILSVDLSLTEDRFGNSEAAYHFEDYCDPCAYN